MASPYRHSEDLTPYQLGAFRSAHAERSGCFLQIVSAAFSALIVAYAMIMGVSPSIVIMMMAVILGGGAALWWIAKRNRRDVILLHERGIVSEKDGRPHVIRFDDVKSITSSKFRRKLAGVETQQHIVEGADGARIAFNLMFDGALELLAAIDAATHERLYAEALKAYDAGEAVRFGPLSISEEGFFDSNRAVVAWSEIDRAAIEMPMLAGGPVHTELKVWKRGERDPFVKYPSERIPNASVLIAMIDLAVQVEDEEIDAN